MVAAAVGGAALALGQAGQPTIMVTATATPTTVPEVSASAPVAQPEPPVDGAIPLPAYAASAIPWDEVGPGWFFLTYDPDTTDNEIVDMGASIYDEGRWTEPKNDVSMTLISPAGDVYYAGSLSDQGTARARLWTGQTLYLFRATKLNYESTYDGVVTALDLASGIGTKVRSGTGYYLHELTIGGRLVGDRSNDGGLEAMVSYRPDGSGERTFATLGVACSELAPDEHTMVCFESRADDRTDVVTYDVDTGTRKVIDVFKRSPWEYWLLGWWSPSSIVFSRYDATTQGQVFLAYDITTKKVTETHPTLPDGSTAALVKGLGRYRVLYSGDYRAAYVYDTNGDLRATLPCGAAAVSGDYALSLCGTIGNPDTVTITVVDLVSGESHDVGTYTAGIHDDVAPFPYRGHSAVYWYTNLIFP